jgi:hypothetical protein
MVTLDMQVPLLLGKTAIGIHSNTPMIPQEPKVYCKLVN